MDGLLTVQETVLHVSISAEANFPVAPKWILMNFPFKGIKVS